MATAATSATKTPAVIKKLDEVVVNRIAAGEVIQRPCNALKEMLENSLDAGATAITVTVDKGGLSMMQIRDDGSGIRKDDLKIVCERFTTSKLRSFSDLDTIATYGFRGEALASISHVARLRIVTKTADEMCGYRADYVDGRPTSDGVTPCAANQGTQITVEDLFFNVPTRKRALKSGSEEFHRVADVVAKYAIHNAGVAFSLKKANDQALHVRTCRDTTLRDNVASVYGVGTARELVDVSKEDPKLGLRSLKGLISNVNYNTKKFNFLLFINHRLVESSALKRALELVYSAYLPKGTHPFVYLSLEIDPRNVDVNVHPTKHEVQFLHQDEITESVQQCVDAKLLGSNSSRTFYTQALLPGAPVKSLEEMEASKLNPSTSKPPQYPKEVVRTDAKEQKLDKFFSPVSSANKGSTNASKDESSKRPRLEAVQEDEDDFREVMAMVEEQEKAIERSPKAAKEPQPEPSKEAAKGSPSISAGDPDWRDIRLDSVLSLRRAVDERSHSGLKDLMRNHSFVGCVSRRLSLVQHSTSLYLVNVPRLSEELFYQLLLRDFGNLGALRLKPPLPIKDLALIALDSKEAGWTEADGTKEELSTYVSTCLCDRAEMLDDYFSMELDPAEGTVNTLPMVPTGDTGEYVPCLKSLPLYVLRLATEVSWADEEACFDSFLRETARFYAVKDDRDSRYDSRQHEDDGDRKEGEDDEGWKGKVERVVFGLGRKCVSPPGSMAGNMTFVKVADLPDLYKVFERC